MSKSKHSLRKFKSTKAARWLRKHGIDPTKTKKTLHFKFNPKNHGG